jgi:hypothetical protein
VAWAAALLALTVSADEAGWRGADGNPLPDSSSRKFADGFGVWLIATSAPQKLPSTQMRTRLADALAGEKRVLPRGDSLVPMIFVLNPGRDASGNANLSCGVKFARPDGSHERSYALRCLTAPIDGGSYDLRQATVPVEFVAAPGDATGTWSIEAVVYDRVRDKSVSVTTTFELADAV